MNKQGEIKASNGEESIALSSFKRNEWISFKIEIDANPYGHCSIWINDQKVADNVILAEAVKSVERISFRTGQYRDIPNRKTPNETPGPPLPGADDSVNEAVFLLDDFNTKRIQ